MRWTVLSGVAAWLAAAGLLAACADGTGPANEQRVAMAPISFNEISGWADDKHAEALASFRRSCPKLTAGPDTKIADDMDSGIRAHLKDVVDADANLKDRDINFDVNNGVVTVKGEVRTAAEKQKVTEIVRAAPGVKDMANALEIKPATP